MTPEKRDCLDCIHAETWVEYGQNFVECGLATSALSEDRNKYRKHWEWLEDFDSTDGGAAKVCGHYETPPENHAQLEFNFDG